MHLGEEKGCYYNDRVDLKLSPSNLEELIRLTEEKALAAQLILSKVFGVP